MAPEKLKLFCLALVIISLNVGCSKSPEVEPNPISKNVDPAGSNPMPGLLTDTQQKALNEAKHTEQMLQDAANARLKTIDNSSAP